MMAAGDSARFVHSFSQNFKLKKQWLRIKDEPLWLYATRHLSQHAPFSRIFITASKDDYTYMKTTTPNFINDIPCSIIQGGDTRAQSLKNALEHVESSFVMVSDVARFDVPRSVVRAMFHALDSHISCVVPYLEVPDTSFYEADVSSYLQREGIKRIQTPQISKVEDLKIALNTHQKVYSDESSALYSMGKQIAFVKGSTRMEKLTFGEDIQMLVHRLEPPSKKCFIGHGIDVHTFEEGKQMWLGGVAIESPFGFKAHSDGDVALHALCDAILGAIGAGDIGEWFPDNDGTYEGIDSKILLTKIYEFAQSIGFELYNADITIMAQSPKLLPYKNSMRMCIASILNVPHTFINIKATTTEGVGFVGRKEGVCAQASVSMGFINWHECARTLLEKADK